MKINLGKRFQFGFLFFWEVLPQYKIEKLTSPNKTFPFDYNLLISLVYILLNSRFVQPLLEWKIKNPGEPLSTDLDHKGVHSTKSLSPIWNRLLLFFGPFLVVAGLYWTQTKIWGGVTMTFVLSPILTASNNKTHQISNSELLYLLLPVNVALILIHRYG